ncbi:MAG: D-Ala-D-Ala carboxypeptidase family metallohydrolase [Fusobacteriaceae bacterium]
MKNNRNKFKFFIFIFVLFYFTGCSSLNSHGKKRDLNSKLSRNFTLKEAIKTDIPISDSIYSNLKYTAKRLEDLRDLLGEPLAITSWYRSPSHNSSVGGASRSGHLSGLAVDFRSSRSHDQRLIFNKIIKSKISYDMIIFYKNQNRMHIGFKRDKSKEQQLIMTNGY